MRWILLAAVAASATSAASCDKTAIRGPAGVGGQGGGGMADGGTGTHASPDARTDDATAPDGGLPGPPMAVDPAVSRAWTWTACGTLAPAAPDQAALFDADGTIAVLDVDGRIRTYDASGRRPLAADGPASFLVNAPDGAVLAGSATATEIVLRPIDATAARFTFTVPAGANTCSPKRAFSVGGDYFLAYGGGSTCVWRSTGGAASAPGDRLPIAVISGSIDQAAIHDGKLVTVAPASDVDPIEIVTVDLAGAEVSRVRLEVPHDPNRRALLSPAGDRIATTAYGAAEALWDAGTGKSLLDFGDLFPGVSPQFTPTGGAVLFGDGVFRTADGARLATLAPASRVYDSQPAALSADGRRLLATPNLGRISLIDLSQPGFAAVLGPQPRSTRPLPARSLAISADASTLAASYGGVVFGFHLAPRFEESRTLWTIYAGSEVLMTDLGGNGQWASAAGDNRALYGGTDGRVIWPQGGVPAVTCYGDLLRISPRGEWAAGAGYGRTMDVFSLEGAEGGTPWKTAAQFPAQCGDVAAFSRDDRIMATSGPALYRLDASGSWQPVWTRFAGVQDSDLPGLHEVHLTPDETAVLVSRCDGPTCVARLHDVATGTILRDLPEITAPRPSFSPEGSWIVAGGQLLHLPSGDTRTLDSNLNVATAVFTPRGEIVAGTRDGALVRYCRGP